MSGIELRGRGARLADATFARAARFGDGWIAGAAPHDQFERAEEEARAYLGDYYAFLGEEVAAFIAAGAAKDAETVRQNLAAFEEGGCGELILCPSSADPDQVDLLADAAGL